MIGRIDAVPVALSGPENATGDSSSVVLKLRGRVSDFRRVYPRQACSFIRGSRGGFVIFPA
jgi:hypothetical protein